MNIFVTTIANEKIKTNGVFKTIIYLYYIFEVMSTVNFKLLKYYVNYLCKPHKICVARGYVNSIYCNWGFKKF